MHEISDTALDILNGSSYTLYSRFSSWLGEECLAEDIPVVDPVEELDWNMRVPERLTFRVPVEDDEGNSWVPTSYRSPLGWFGQRIHAQVGVGVEHGAIEWVNRGVFLLHSADTTGSDINVEALGMLQLADEAELATEFQPTAGASFISTLRQLLEPGILVDIADSAPTNKTIPTSAVTWSDNRLDCVYTILDAWPAQARMAIEGVLEVTAVPDLPTANTATLASVQDSGDWTIDRPNGSVYTVSSVTVEEDDLLLVFSSVGAGEAEMSTPSGGGLTYTLRQKPNADDDTNHNDCWLWTATADTDATFNITSTLTTVPDRSAGLLVMVWRNAVLGATAGDEDAGTAPNLPLTTQADNSTIVSFVGDYFSINAARTWRTIEEATFTEDFYVRAGIQQAIYLGHWTNVGLAGSKTTGLSAPTGQRPNAIAVEIIGTESGISFAFNDTDEGTVIEWSTSGSREDGFNAAIVEGVYDDDRGSLSGLPIVHTAYDVDSDSPYSLGGEFSPYLVPRKFQQPLLNEHVPVLLAAYAKIRDMHRRAFRTVKIQCVPHPALDLDDICSVTSTRLGIDGEIGRISALRLPYDASGGAMEVIVKLAGFL